MTRGRPAPRSRDSILRPRQRASEIARAEAGDESVHTSTVDATRGHVDARRRHHHVVDDDRRAERDALDVGPTGVEPEEGVGGLAAAEDVDKWCGREDRHRRLRNSR